MTVAEGAAEAEQARLELPGQLTMVAQVATQPFKARQEAIL